MLHVRDLTAGHRPDTPVVRSVSFHLPTPGVYAIVGPNGAGKTTLLHTLAGHLRATTGQIVLGGRDLTGLLPHHLARAGVALAPQGRRLWPSLTVRDHLTITRPATGGGFSVDDLFDLFPPLAARRRHHGHQLSGGEQQMLTIARALRTNPRLLLADEPTEGLSPRIAGQVIAVLRDLPDRGVTVLVALPQAHTATAVADRVYALNAGQLSDPPDGHVDLLVGDHRTPSNAHRSSHHARPSPARRALADHPRREHHQADDRSPGNAPNSTDGTPPCRPA
ncbi:ABC transporter ATP-binding protein [Micromonospora wenchangensis]|uniref:ABC transporter ATP-binding protein n=1 Tax=Micromonospora wenchangensis TaxID=1185415 RepID=UPI003D73A60B